MEKLKVMQRIVDCGIVAVVRANSPDEALKIAEAVREGGVEAIEITMTVPSAIEVIRELARTYQNKEILIGAGTVLDAETARAAILAGADFLVSPSLNYDMVRLCNRYQKVTMPGAMSIREIIEVMEAGGDFVKFFPGSAFGPEMIMAIKGPLPQAPLVPTGGVSLDNVREWIKAGCEAVGVGSELTKEAKKGNFGGVTDTARRFVQAIKEARGF